MSRLANTYVLDIIFLMREMFEIKDTMKTLCSVATLCLGQEVLRGEEGLLRLQCVSLWVSWPSFLPPTTPAWPRNSQQGSQRVSHTQNPSSQKDALGLVSHVLPVAQPPEGLISALSNFTNAHKFRASLGNWDFVSHALILVSKP